MNDLAPRTFAVARDGSISILSHEEHLSLLGISPAVSAAVDLLTDDGYPVDEAAQLVLAAERAGREPEAWARHFLKLRRVARQAFKQQEEGNGG